MIQMIREGHVFSQCTQLRVRIQANHQQADRSRVRVLRISINNEQFYF